MSTLSEGAQINELASVVHQRWRKERDGQVPEQDVDLGHYESPEWWGVHRHAAWGVAAYGCRWQDDSSLTCPLAPENLIKYKGPALPEGHLYSGSLARATPRGDDDCEAAQSVCYS